MHARTAWNGIGTLQCHDVNAVIHKVGTVVLNSGVARGVHVGSYAHSPYTSAPFKLQF